jgi:NADH-quinone oxidoreductase subunit F
MKKVSDRIEEGKATPDDVKTLEEIAYQIDGKTVCAFGEASAWPVEAMIDKYRDELLAETSADNDYKSSERLEQEKFLAAVR